MRPASCPIRWERRSMWWFREGCAAIPVPAVRWAFPVGSETIRAQADEPNREQKALDSVCWRYPSGRRPQLAVDCRTGRGLPGSSQFTAKTAEGQRRQGNRAACRSRCRQLGGAVSLLWAPVHHQNGDSSDKRQGTEKRREVDLMMLFLVDLERSDVHFLLLCGVGETLIGESQSP